jgi:hypothetical protein
MIPIRPGIKLLPGDEGKINYQLTIKVIYLSVLWLLMTSKIKAFSEILNWACFLLQSSN